MVKVKREKNKREEAKNTGEGEEVVHIYVTFTSLFLIPTKEKDDN